METKGYRALNSVFKYLTRKTLIGIEFFITLSGSTIWSLLSAENGKIRLKYSFLRRPQGATSVIRPTLFCDVMPCSLVQQTEGTCCLHLQGRKEKMGSASSYQAWVNIYQPTQCHNRDGNNKLKFLWSTRQKTLNDADKLNS